MNANSIHRIADRMGISWDGDKNFMSWCENLVGKKHLDDMSEVELLMVYTRIKNGKYPESLNKNG
jgi:hypothetical protein